MRQLGTVIRQKREELLKKDRRYSQLQVSKRIGIEQSYLSKIERGATTQLSEEKIVALAEILGEDPDFLLALGGKVSGDVLAIIKQRPLLFSRLVRDMKNMSEDVIEADHDFKRRQSRMDRIYDFAAMGFFHLEEHPECSMWSSHTPGILGLSAHADPCLESVADALCPADRERFLAVERESFHARRPYTCELRLKGDHEQPRHVRIWGDYDAPADADGVVRLGLIQDVTKEVSSREELRLAHQALSGTVEQQSRQVAQGIEELKREIAARKELEGELRAINEDIARQKDVQREYLRQSAYELRSLVNRLVVGKGALREETLSGTLSLISTTIDSMNDFFEIQSGMSPLAEAFSPKAAAESWIADLAHAQRNPDLELRLTVSPDMPDRIVGDPQRLQQITVSVVRFLLKTTAWGTIQVTLDYLADRELLGMTASSPSIAERITGEDFEPHSGKGSGTSSWMLSTVGPMVEALGGELTLGQPPGNGVTISILVPSRPTPEPPREAMDAGLPILVVEDDQSCRFFAESIIKKSGHPVETAALGQEALARLGQRRYGLVLLDIQLPDIDGVTIARAVRQAGSPNAQTPIIAVTAHATPEDRLRYESAGIDQFIAKPFKIETLTKMIGGYIGPGTPSGTAR
ncbi:MAG: response regulator [Pseudodesulfovibrio sp.]